MTDKSKFLFIEPPVISDFPAEGIEVIHIEGEHEVTDRICEECKGTRGKVTHIFRVTKILLHVGKEAMTFEEFERQFPETGAFFRQHLFGETSLHPTCIACQEDMRMACKTIVRSVVEEI